MVTPIGYGSVTSRWSGRLPLTVTRLPVAVGVPVSTVTSVWPLGACAVLSEGQVMVGCGVSTTVIVNVQLGPLVPTFDVTAVEPTGKNDPEAGVDVTAP